MDNKDRTGAGAARDASEAAAKVAGELARAKAQGGTLLKTLKDIVGPLERSD